MVVLYIMRGNSSGISLRLLNWYWQWLPRLLGCQRTLYWPPLEVSTGEEGTLGPNPLGRNMTSYLSPVDRMTDTCKNITFPQLRLRMVINFVTRMHSSRMCTVHYSGRLLVGVCPGSLPAGGPVCPGGVCPKGGMSAQNGGVCLRCICLEGSLPGGVYITNHGQTDTCENITFPHLLLQTVKTVQYCRPLLGDQQVYLIRIVHLALLCLYPIRIVHLALFCLYLIRIVHLALFCLYLIRIVHLALFCLYLIRIVYLALFCLYLI